MRGRSLAVPPEEAFAFHVPLSVPFFTDLWTKGQRREVPELRLGDAQLVDLRDDPVVSLDTPFDSLRFYIPQIALDEMEKNARFHFRPVQVRGRQSAAQSYVAITPIQNAANMLGPRLLLGLPG